MKTLRIFGLPVASFGEADERNLNPENPNTPLGEWLAQLTGYDGTGETVNTVTAMRYSAVYACVRIISETIASLPINILENNPFL